MVYFSLRWVYFAPAAGLPAHSAQLLPAVRVQPDAACLSHPELGNDRLSIEMDSQKTQICSFPRTPRPLSNFQLNLFPPRSHNFPHQLPSAVESDQLVAGRVEQVISRKISFRAWVKTNASPAETPECNISDKTISESSSSRQKTIDTGFICPLPSR